MGHSKVIQTALPDVNKVGELKPSPVAILDCRLVKRGNKPVTMVLVQWSNNIPEDATWETWEKLTLQYAEFDPWGQGSSQAKGNCYVKGTGEESL